jgi:hypothetical protein
MPIVLANGINIQYTSRQRAAADFRRYGGWFWHKIAGLAEHYQITFDPRGWGLDNRRPIR